MLNTLRNKTRQMIVLTALFLSLVFGGCSQPSATPEKYKIYFSPHAALFTYLLDAQSGDVWVLVKDSQGDQAWQKMKKHE